MISKAWKITQNADKKWSAAQWDVDEYRKPIEPTGRVTARHLTRPELEADMLKQGIGHQDIIGD